MQTPEERLKKMDALAKSVLTISRNTLHVSYRFLDMALSMFDYVPGKGGIAVDGTHLYYDPVWVLGQYQEEKTVMTRNYFHMVLHCIFHHSFLHTNINQALWSLACDAAVENVIDELETRGTWAKRSLRQIPFLSELRRNVKNLTAEKIYNYLVKTEMTDAEAAMIRRDFIADEHAIWFETPEPQLFESRDPKEQADDQSATADAENAHSSLDDGKDDEKSREADDQDGSTRATSKTEDIWKNIAERMQTELETFSKEHGDAAGSLTQNLSAVTREKYDYADFLRRFAAYGEAIQINDEEFDTIFYTYGMKLYHKMPLIEPLEYKDARRIREFVIAIDTSGSVSGELVQAFITKTYNILKQQESFFRKINLHIIQCDADIQEDVRISSREEFEDYIEKMQLHGFGGTDFRPVFQYVEKLQKEHAFFNLNGLIYFTDGYGTFPEQPPGFRTAFVFVEDEYNNPEVPVWAIKLVLPAEDI